MRLDLRFLQLLCTLSLSGSEGIRESAHTLCVSAMASVWYEKKKKNASCTSNLVLALPSDHNGQFSTEPLDTDKPNF